MVDKMSIRPFFECLARRGCDVKPGSECKETAINVVNCSSMPQSKAAQIIYYAI
jgi:hypothetical protein